MDKKIHTGHPGKNAQDESPWKAKTLIRSSMNGDFSSKDHNPVDKKFFAAQPGKNTQFCLKLKF